MSKHVTVRGADEVARTMRAAGKAVEDMRPANLDAADVVAKRAKGNAPRRSGALASAIETRATASAASVTSHLVYAGVQEGGWRRRNIPATRYIQRAVDSTQGQVDTIYEQAVAKAVGKIKGV